MGRDISVGFGVVSADPWEGALAGPFLLSGPWQGCEQSSGGELRDYSSDNRQVVTHADQ